MKRTLILFGTTDGHTRKVAEFLGEALRAEGAAVDVCDAAASNPDPMQYCGVIVAASVHLSGYQRSVLRWLQAWAPGLSGRPSAFVSVCLGVMQKDPDVQRELSKIIDGFLVQTRWAPDRVKIVAGALLYRRYGWLKRRMMRRIVRKAGGDTDTSRNYEYTDWKDLSAFARTFCTLALPAVRTPLSPQRREATRAAWQSSRLPGSGRAACAR